MKDIPGFEGKYAATRDGRIWSYPKKNDMGYGTNHNGRFLTPINVGRGYFRVSLGRTSSKLIHRLVAETYLLNPNKLRTVNHKNGIKTDNRVKNLEWTSHKENMNHAIITGLYDLKGEKHPNSKLSEDDVREIRARYIRGKVFQKEIAALFGVHTALVSQIVNNRIWTHI